MLYADLGIHAPAIGQGPVATFKPLVTGVTGPKGSRLAKLLTRNGYEVFTILSRILVVLT